MSHEGEQRQREKKKKKKGERTLKTSKASLVQFKPTVWLIVIGGKFHSIQIIYNMNASHAHKSMFSNRFLSSWCIREHFHSSQLCQSL